VTDRDHPTVRIYNYDRYMIVHMTRLYIRLVSYVRLYILTLLIFFYHDIRFIPDIDYFIYFYSLSYCYSLHCYYARAPFSLHTLLLGRF